jgi:hypothetical protein
MTQFTIIPFPFFIPKTKKDIMRRVTSLNAVKKEMLNMFTLAIPTSLAAC